MGFFGKDFKDAISIKNNPIPRLSGYNYKSYKNGKPYVPQTKKYLLHKGEMVIPKKEATILRRNILAEKKRKAPIKKKNKRSKKN